MADLGAHGILHSPIEEHMTLKSRVSHSMLGSATYKPVNRISRGVKDSKHFQAVKLIWFV